MDLQGTPIAPGSRSTKVTTDPRATQQPIEEPAGPVPTGSLAAESVRQGGAFSENRGAQPEDISASQLKNTNAHTTLSSAPAGGLREDRQTKQTYPEALGGQGNFPGTHISGYAGGSTAAKQEMGMNTGNSASASGSSQYNGGNASFDADAGSEQDPGRAAINKFEHSNAKSAFDAGVPRQKGVNTETPYDALETDQRA
ncbi:hypothetical protein N7520_010062 [Penicillium odoratum]|uniref:uncharacterized protein n=1 Tax=Penicillium odoratum TaxID=1167516 RepID=UPI002549B36E|nr:uncharacterized protein N7520_010062 [Penicillium odoratum]KAJ5753145.1 hypothetical protein N7520_010062 [Penicillium odoratum]